MDSGPIFNKLMEFAKLKTPESLLVCDFILDHLLYNCDGKSEEEIIESVSKITEKIIQHASEINREIGKNDYFSLTWTVDDIIQESEFAIDEMLTKEEVIDFISKYSKKILDWQIINGWQVIDMYLQEYKESRDGKSSSQ